MNDLFEHLEEERGRIEDCLERLPDDLIWRRPRTGVNSIGNLCIHLWGNESYYLGSGVGGVAFQRDRSGEFNAEGGASAEELSDRLRSVREGTRTILAGLGERDLERIVDVNYPPEPTALRVILHVVTHYSYHTGQIVQRTRIVQQGDERVLEWGH